MSNNKTDPNEPINTTNYRESYTSIGLTKREYFASMAMQGILSSRELQITLNQDRIEWSVFSVEMADKLIEALNIEGNNEQQ